MRPPDDSRDPQDDVAHDPVRQGAELRHSAASARGSMLATTGALGHHVMMRLVDGRTLTESPRDRRAAARVLYEQGEHRRLLAFRVADTHVHVLLVGSREQAGSFATYVGCALRWALGLSRPFAPSFVQPVLDQRHLYNAFRYVFRQEQRHGTAHVRGGSNRAQLRAMQHNEWHTTYPCHIRVGS